MAIDREASLRNAEKFLRVGRLDAAITEYARIVEDQPRDWTTANTLGDLYLRAGQSEKAVALYQGIADHLLSEGFYPRAAALLKKILKITPADESALVHLGDIAARQGLLAEARGYYTTVSTRRREREDEAGADEMILKLGLLDPADLDARLKAARIRQQRGDAAVNEEFRELFDEFLKNDRPNGAEQCLDTIVEASLAAGDHAAAARSLVAFLETSPAHMNALLRLVEVSVDGGLDETMYRAQAGLADAYLEQGRAAEARVIAEDLLAHDPADPVHRARLSRALRELGIDETRVPAPSDVEVEELEEPAVVEAEQVVAVATLPAEATSGSVTTVETIVETLDERREPQSAETPMPVASPRESSSPPLSQEQPAPGAARPGGSMEIDLTSVLGDLQGMAAPPPTAEPRAEDLEQVFAQMREEAVTAENDTSDDYLDLARSYIELGLTDEAIGALKEAASSPRSRFVAATLLAQLHRDTGDLPAAIEWYERAAEAPATSPDEARGVLYDLGDLLEAMGESDRALAIFMELSADSPGFRDVRERVSKLSPDVAGG